jgi:thiol-disulfide isomerase/thioredoxin
MSARAIESLSTRSPSVRSAVIGAAAVLLALVATGRDAQAIPAFARKYKTSCATCHTIFPKLNPFGEAFRRNGFRFPGIDSDAVKGEVVPLGQEAYKKMFPDQSWPGSLAASAPVALGFNGAAVFHPDTKSSAGAADNNSAVVLDNLVEEGHLWAGGSIDDSITFFGELTFAPDGVGVETAHVHFNDLIGPTHVLNLTVGKAIPTLSSFGPHSTYLGDMYMPQVGITALYGATSDPFILNENHEGVELTGTAAGRLDYSAGVTAGTNVDVRNSGTMHAHVGYKIGGLPLDGEGVAADATPQEEQAVTLDAFVVRSTAHFANAAAEIQRDTSLTVGGDARLELGALEFDAGGYWQRNDHALANGAQTSALVQWDELSYLVYPWLAPALRVEYVRVTPVGQPTVADLRITPGAAVLVRPNLKLVVTVPLEHANGAPDLGWDAAGGAAAPASPTSTIGLELEAIAVTMFYAF